MIYAIISLLTVLGNGLVIFTIAITPSLQTVSNMIVVSLGCADLSVGLFVLPLRMSEVLQASLSTTIEYCRFSHGFSLLNLSASVFSITILAIDRFLAINYPFKYQRLAENKKICVIVIITVWVTAIVIAFLPVMGPGAGKNSGKRRLEGLCIFSETLDGKYLLFYSALMVFVSFLIITVLYIKIFIVARRHVQRIAILHIDQHQSMDDNRNMTQSGSLDDGNDSIATQQQISIITIETTNFSRNDDLMDKTYTEILETNSYTDLTKDLKAFQKDSSVYQSVQRKKAGSLQRDKRKKILGTEIKAAKIMLLVVGALYISWIPTIGTIIATAICGYQCVSQMIVAIVTFLLFSNSFVNPVIYYFRFQSYRNAMKQTVKKLVASCRKI